MYVFTSCIFKNLPQDFSNQYGDHIFHLQNIYSCHADTLIVLYMVYYSLFKKVSFSVYILLVLLPTRACVLYVIQLLTYQCF